MNFSFNLIFLYTRLNFCNSREKSILNFQKYERRALKWDQEAPLRDSFLSLNSNYRQVVLFAVLITLIIDILRRKTLCVFNFALQDHSVPRINAPSTERFSLSLSLSLRLAVNTIRAYSRHLQAWNRVPVSMASLLPISRVTAESCAVYAAGFCSTCNYNCPH